MVYNERSAPMRQWFEEREDTKAEIHQFFAMLKLDESVK